MFLRDRFRPITDTMGLFELDPARCASAYTTWMQPNSPDALVTDELSPGGLRLFLGALCPLQRIGMTKVLFAPVGEWTACFTNGWRGTDMSSIAPMLALTTGCTALRVTSIPDLGQGARRRYGARIVQLFRGGRVPTRGITVANDGGRWVERYTGESLPEEDEDWFVAPRLKDRFTQGHLRTLLSRLVPRMWEVEEGDVSGAFLVHRVETQPPVHPPLDLEVVQRDIPTIVTD